MRLVVRAAFALAAPVLLSFAPATAAATAPVLTTNTGVEAMAAGKDRYPLFAAEVERAKASVDEAMRLGINVPLPKDPGGGFTHELHKRNYKAIHDAGMLFRITGDDRYAGYVREMLLAYAALYPRLGPHPAGRGQIPGRLFWQTLNDSVWLVHGIQGYDAIRDTLSDADRRTIDEQLFRRMASFLSEETPANFDRIHNHATWAVAGVGMTGYVLRDEALVEKALLGLDRSGKSGFLRQLDLLFSPDGYYAEGPYYQRYALMPFVVFARAIEMNDPERKIFEYRDGIVPKAIRTTVQLTYGGLFFPINDAMKDKGLRTEELYHGIAIAYGRTRDPTLLSIAEKQRRTVLSSDGLLVATGLAEGLAEPFPFRSLLLRDGPEGEGGALAILRSGSGPDHQALVVKNTSQGMGHGHFDKLNWLFYDNGHAIVTDYGAARFLNIEAKSGGTYLPENTSWAKQTIAHNTLVVNEESHFGGDWNLGETMAPTPLFFEAGEETQIVSARMAGAYDDVVFTRTMALVEHDDLPQPVVIDLLKADGEAPAQYDLPLHYNGQIIELGFPLESNVAERPVLGAANGYQHLWVDAVGRPSGDNGFVTWLTGDRFYTYRFLPREESELILAETGANDPNFNLRREPLLIQRLRGAADASFVGVLEPHGEYSAAAEYTIGSRSRIAALKHFSGADADVVLIETGAGSRIALGIAHEPDPARKHSVIGDGRTFEWSGFYARFDE